MQIRVPLALSKMGLPQSRGFINAVNVLCNDFVLSESVSVMIHLFQQQCKAMNNIYANTEINTCRKKLQVADKERVQQLIAARKCFAGLLRNETYIHQSEAAKTYEALMAGGDVGRAKRQERSAFFIEALGTIAKLDSGFVASREYDLNIKPLIVKQQNYSDAETNLATARGKVGKDAKIQAVKACISQFRSLVSSLESCYNLVSDADAHELLSKINGLMETEITVVKSHDALVANKRIEKEEKRLQEAAQAEEQRKQDEKHQQYEAAVLDQVRTEEAYNYLKQNHPEMLR